jgi:hypothetical protein
MNAPQGATLLAFDTSTESPRRSRCRARRAAVVGHAEPGGARRVGGNLLPACAERLLDAKPA